MKIATWNVERLKHKHELDKILNACYQMSATKRLCICGDFNCSFGDNYYYTKSGRIAIQDCFFKNHIDLLTKNCTECIDHIALSRGLVDGAKIHIDEWNLDKQLSDHKGIAVTIA